MKPLCIYHGKCADGFTAAWIVAGSVGDVDFYPGIYQDAPPDVIGRDVILVDFSYKRPVLDAMATQANSILILDHHKTAADDLADLPKAPSFSIWKNAAWDGHLSQKIRMVAIFDMERSGAQVAWDYFHGDGVRPALVDYVGDRDLWRFKLPYSRAVNAYVFAHEYTFENWDLLGQEIGASISSVAGKGMAIEKKHHKDIAELVEGLQRRMTIGGHDVPVANLPYTLTSDAGHLMAKGEPFAACYWDTADGRVFSLRSADDGMDVSAVAKQYGGGGHPRASGFRMPIGWEGDSRTA